MADEYDAHSEFFKAATKNFGVKPRDVSFNPPVSERQRRMMGAALGRKRSGRSLPSDPKMTTAQLREFAGKVKK